MFNTVRSIAFVIALMFAPGALAQSGETIVVTGSMIEEDYGPSPYVTIRVRADFVLFSLTYESGSRDAAVRQTELSRMLTDVTRAAQRADDVALRAGDPEEYAAIETVTLEELLREQRNTDRSSIPLVLQVRVRNGDTFNDVRERAMRFVNGVQLQGRTEALVGDEQYLEIENPAAHRQGLLEAIAADLASVSRTMGQNAEARVTGIGAKLISRPSGPLEVEMAIPYDLQITIPSPR